MKQLFFHHSWNMDKKLNGLAIEQADRLFDEGEKKYHQDHLSDYLDVFEKAAIIYEKHELWDKYILALTFMGKWFYKHGKFEKAKEILEETLEIHQEKNSENKRVKYRLHSTLVNVLINLEEQEKAMENAQICLSIAQGMDDAKSVISSYVLMGKIHSRTYKNRQALQFYYKALNIKEIRGYKNHELDCYLNVAIAYYYLNQNTLAQTYLQKVLFLYEKEKGPNYFYASVVKGILAEVTTKLGDYAQAKIYCEEAIAFRKKFNVRTIDDANLLLQLGIIYTRYKEWEQAEKYIQRTLDLQKEISPNDYEWLISTYLILIENCVYVGALKKAFVYLQQAEKILPFLSATYNYYIVTIYFNYASIYQEQGLLKEALDCIQKGFEGFENATDEFLQSNKHFLLELECLQISVSYKLFQKHGSKNYLEDALQLIPKVETLANKNLKEIFQEKDQLRFNQRVSDFYQNAINVLFELYVLNPNQKLLNKIFTLAEKNKVHTLLSTIQKTEALQLSAIPVEKLQEIQQLQSKINHYQTLLQKTDINTDAAIFDHHAEQFANLQVEYHQLFQQIEQEHPEYLELKHQMPSIQLKDLQSQLQAHQATISYVLGDEFLYLLYADRQHIRLERAIIAKDFLHLLDTFTGEAIVGMNRKAYVQQAHQLYQHLIAPVEEKLKENNINKLLILPDNQLLELPFELLLTKAISFKTAYSQMPYLLKKYSIIYHYSATLRHYQQIRNQSEKTQNLPPQFLGFAPVYDERQFTSNVSEALPVEATRDVSIRGMSYKALLYSEKEVKDIEANFQQKGWESQVFLRSKANLEEFKQKVQAFKPKYLHIAAHGVSNEKKNVLGILFSPEEEKDVLPTSIPSNVASASLQFQSRQQSTSPPQSAILYAHELYQLQLKSDLVFLSCCESGVGKIAAGEGILSLNRGLLYAGVSNIIFTLFKIYDQKTAIFARHFYDYLLNQEENYAEALRYAKLQLLEENLPPRYWGGFLLLGN